MTDSQETTNTSAPAAEGERPSRFAPRGPRPEGGGEGGERPRGGRRFGGGKTGTCARHQRSLTTAIKRSRHVALLPFVGGTGRF